jgi:signal transduction histidine kinase/CheY-like chemotaxis protein
MILYFLPAAFALALIIGIYSLYDNRKVLKTNILIYLFSAVSMIWTASVWICFMDFAPSFRRAGLFAAEAATASMLPVITSILASKERSLKIGRYGEWIVLALYGFFMLFHCFGFFVTMEIQDGKALIVSGSDLIFYVYLAYHVLTVIFWVVLMFIMAYKSGFKREKVYAFLFFPLFGIGLYLFILRFTYPASRLGGCFAQTIVLVLCYVFSKQFNVRVVSETQVAGLMFSTVGTNYLFAGLQGDIFYANNSALDFFGMSLEAIQGKHLGDLFIFEKEPGTFGRRREQANVQDEYRAQAVYSGALCHISIIYRWDNWDELFCVIIKVEDITEREQLIRQMEQAKQKAEDAARAKNIFLANTSHEIRTPMNAILGMVELILRHEINQEVYEHAISIKQAGTSLLTIINDVLDFSKIESGKLDIVPSEYRFSSLINDCVSIIRMRITEKPLLFIVDIDAKLPDELIGDVVRVRQVMINLLSNAVKYTNKGHIIFSVTGEILPSAAEFFDTKETDDSAVASIEDGYEQIILTVKVSDTGVGIKEEDICKLFGEFQQLDSHREHSIEGTGLGLAISRNLCRQMGGDITVQSEFGKGSVFTVLIPQVIRENIPIAQVHNPETKPVLLYERKTIYEESLIASFESLGVQVKVVRESDRFFLELEGGQYSYAFVSASLADQTIRELHDLEKPAVPVILAGAGEISSSREAPVLNMPAYVIPIANVLNGKRMVNFPEKAAVRFTAPDARVLIVDDIQTNLIVAQGLLSLYRMDIHTAVSGAIAIEMVSERNYDLILMDHMMPEMDGIEATAKIRALEESRRKEKNARDFRPTPIIALTANAVSGMKEMFLQNGFNDFLSKPIEIPKLDEIVAKWIPREKKKVEGVFETAQNPAVPKGPAHLSIEGVDTARGIIMTGGSEEGYKNVLAVLYSDIEKRLEDFIKLAGRPEPLLFTKDEYANFTVQVHALKSALATIGASDLSLAAAVLEAAGKDGQQPIITEKLPAFIRDLKALNKAITPKSPDIAGDHGILTYSPALGDLRKALLAYDIGRINLLMKQLETETPATRKEILRLSELILLGDYREAAEFIEELP